MTTQTRDRGPSLITGVKADAVPAFLLLLDAMATAEPVCRTDPEAWFADTAAARAEAAEACASCPLAGPCGAYAQAAGEKHGVWGGHDHAPKPGPKGPRSKEIPA